MNYREHLLTSNQPLSLFFLFFTEFLPETTSHCLANPSGRLLKKFQSCLEFWTLSVASLCNQGSACIVIKMGPVVALVRHLILNRVASVGSSMGAAFVLLCGRCVSLTACVICQTLSREASHSPCPFPFTPFCNPGDVGACLGPLAVVPPFPEWREPCPPLLLRS